MIHASATPTPVEDVTEQTRQWLSALDVDWWLAGFIVVGMLLALVIGRVAIRVITRGLEHGANVSTAQARKALRKAKIPLPPAVDATQARLEAERRKQRSRTVRAVLNSTWSVLVILVGVIMLLSVIGVPVTPLLASAGVVGVALGFGAQSLVRDVLSGVFMLAEDQYGVGDIIDVGEAAGVVEAVGLRTTRLRNLEGIVWWIPNGEIRRVGNMTQLWSRVVMDVRFSFDTDPDEARQALLDAVAQARTDEQINRVIVGEPEVPGIEALEFNAVTIRLLLQVTPAAQWNVRRAVFKALKEIIRERDIRLAAPEGALIQSASDTAPTPATARGTTRGTPGGTASAKSQPTAARSKPAAKPTKPATKPSTPSKKS